MGELPEEYLQIAADLMPEAATFSETCAVARAILKAKNDALEEAAKVCIYYGPPAHADAYDAMRNVAQAIRNLKHEG